MGKSITTEDEDKICIMIGAGLAKLGKNINSGNAKGCDNAYAQGANVINSNLVNLYIVDDKHNPHFIVPGNKIILNNKNTNWVEEAKKHHTSYYFMNSYVKKLFNRNAGIVLSSEILIAWPDKSKKNWGGTGHSMRVAIGANIPIIDISIEEIRKNLLLSLKGLINYERVYRDK